MSDELAEAKQRLRGRMAQLRGGVEPEVALEAAVAAAARLVSLESARTARCVGLYAALLDELGTRPLFEAVIGLGASACVPRAACDGRLEFVSIDSWDALQKGRYGVLEPEVDAAGIEFGADDVVVVPGVAFDADGNRLGRGKGYYDRTFAPGALGAPTLIGFAYEFQLVDRVPSDVRDRRVDAVVTECGMHGQGVR